MTGAEYRKLLIQYRRSQLALTEVNIKRLEGVFDRAIRSVIEKLTTTEAGSLQEHYSAALLGDLDDILKGLRVSFADLLMAGMTESAQTAADREAATATSVSAPKDPRLFVDASQSFIIPGAEPIRVSFGTVARSAVERCASRVYADGWKLSNRLERLDQALRATIQDTIVQGVAEQISAKEMAKRLQSSLMEAGSDNPRYQAMRIARTEINTAHREAHILSTIDPQTHRLKDYIQAIGWRLSMSHPKSDVCDIYASHDSGMGTGNYLPEDVPSSHPHCLCYTITVLTDYPDINPPNKAAEPENVPPAQAQYYADKYDDPAAKAWLDTHTQG